MPGKYEAPRGGRRRKPRKSPIFPIFLILILIAGVGFAAWKFLPGFIGGDPDPTNPGKNPSSVLGNWGKDDPTEPSTVPTEPKPEAVHQIASATVVSTGDLLMHMPVIDASIRSGGTYDFTHVFKYVEPYVSAADYAAANLETTLCGTDNGYEYHGYPHFNCPDEIVTGAMDAGFDMMLTANNHSYDTTLVGYKRTLEVIRGEGMDTLGTYASADEVKWTIKEINGINIGMLCYTYATHDVDGRPRLNGNTPIAEAGLCNYFIYENLPAFYTEVETYLDEMETAGAEATIVYIHWGIEYQTYANDQQKAIAQKLCDLGVDVIVGGHPHVVQPIDLLTSTTDPEHKTVCLYSMGNAVSNQRREFMNLKTGHTEDGMLFSVTFSKYSDGTVYVDSTDILPTWVNMYNPGTGKEYNILPLDDETMDDWKTLYNINDTLYSEAKKSYDRTMAIVREGLEECQSYLAQSKQQRDETYLAAVQ